MKPTSFVISLSLLVFSISTILYALTFGSAHIAPAEVAKCLVEQCSSASNELVIWQLRLPRVLVGFVAGMGLSCAGALLQNTTRNPLADPYLFGIVAGAGLGVTIISLTLNNRFLSPEALLSIAQFSLPLAAFVGALFSVTIVFFISSIMQRMEQLLLAGVAVSFMLSAISQFILYLGEPMATNRVMFWLMGSLARVNMQQFTLIAITVLLGYIAIFALHRRIDCFALGDENASYLGVNIQQTKLIVLVICAALTAVIVAYCGGIAFVGLMIPHIVRYLFGSNTLLLTLISGVLGGCFLVWVDVVARAAVPHLEIPIGIITSAIGSAFFLLVMFHSRKSTY
jgi:iron complex transport system permease protein